MTTDVTVPLPGFRQPHHHRLDPDLPPVDAPPMEDLDPDPTDSRHPRPSPTLPDDGQPPPPPKLDHEAPTRRSWVGSGDPVIVGKMVAGLLAIGISAAAAFLAQARGRHLRKPTGPQLDAVAFPVGRILVRHLPLAVIGQDLFDATEATYAAQAYLLDGPLVERIPTTEGDHQ